MNGTLPTGFLTKGHLRRTFTLEGMRDGIPAPKRFGRDVAAISQAAGQIEMQTSETGTKNKKPKSKGTVVSNNSILILSTFLIGIGAGKASNPTVGMWLFLMGIFGVISYIGLGHIARQRKDRVIRRKQKRAAKKLELRMGRHIPRPTASSADPRRDEATVENDRQFGPATGSQQLTSC